jgi:hypothetical protein
MLIKKKVEKLTCVIAAESVIFWDERHENK